MFWGVIEISGGLSIIKLLVNKKSKMSFDKN